MIAQNENQFSLLLNGVSVKGYHLLFTKTLIYCTINTYPDTYVNGEF